VYRNYSQLLQEPHHSLFSAITSQILQNAIQRQPQRAKQAKAHCLKKEGPEEECSKQNFKEPSRDSKEQRSTSYWRSSSACVWEEGKKAGESRESCKEESNREGNGARGRSSNDWYEACNVGQPWLIRVGRCSNTDEEDCAKGQEGGRGYGHRQ
jgi:hypothetical protein